MADPKNDITTEITKTPEELIQYKKDQFAENPSTRLARPAQVAEVQQGLNPELVQRLKMGQRTIQLNGILRCIRIVDEGTPHAHHCMSMIVNNLSANESICSRCTRQQNAGDPRPKVINSSMIRLTRQDLEEMGLKEDPLFKGVPPPEAPQVESKPLKRVRKVKAEIETKPRRVKMPVPNKVTIEVTMEELKSDPNVVKTLLNKALESIFELPVKNFREAEEIRVVKERVESFLKEGE